MSQMLVRRRPELTSLCENLEVNPRNEDVWLELFGDYLSKHICTVIVKRTIHSRGIKSEYLAWVE